MARGMTTQMTIPEGMPDADRVLAHESPEPPPSPDVASKTFNSGSDESLGLGVAADQEPEPEKNEPEIPQPEAKFTPGSIVYSRANNQTGKVLAVERLGRDHVYSLILFGANKEKRGWAICAEGDLELRRQRAAKASVPAPSRDDLLMLAGGVRLAKKKVDQDAFTERTDAVLQEVLNSTRRFVEADLEQGLRNNLEGAVQALEDARQAWGESDHTTLAGKLDNAINLIQSAYNDLEPPTQKAADIYAPGGPVLQGEGVPSMQSIVDVLTTTKAALGQKNNGSVQIIPSLKQCGESLKLIANTTENVAALRSIELMGSLIAKVVRALQGGMTISPNARYAVNSGDARNSVFNSLSQAAFLGQMMMQRMEVKSLKRTAVRHGMSTRAAVRLWREVTRGS